MARSLIHFRPLPANTNYEVSHEIDQSNRSKRREASTGKAGTDEIGGNTWML